MKYYLVTRKSKKLLLILFPIYLFFNISSLQAAPEAAVNNSAASKPGAGASVSTGASVNPANLNQVIQTLQQQIQQVADSVPKQLQQQQTITQQEIQQLQQQVQKEIVTLQQQIQQVQDNLAKQITALQKQMQDMEKIK